jgi:hypothetical protein
MKELVLTKGKVALVDDEDFERLSKYKWTTQKGQKGGYYAHRTITVSLNCKKKILLHRQILGISDPNIKVDHKDRNSLNNQKENLRICTQSQNLANRESKLGSTSKYLGVSWHKVNKIWVASINKGPKKYLGSFRNEVDAAKAYNEAASKVHGEFANLNVL